MNEEDFALISDNNSHSDISFKFKILEFLVVKNLQQLKTKANIFQFAYNNNLIKKLI